MTKPIRFDREAEQEVSAAFDWYEAQRAGLGSDLLAVVDESIARIADSPELFPFVPMMPSELAVRRCPVIRFPYSIVFVELPTEIRVLALAHSRRRPSYWRSRL